MELNKLRIGYVPMDNRLTQPGDRRRFCYYASKRNIKFEIADPSQDYDLVILTERADISLWSRYKKGKAKVIYDFVDSYLAVRHSDIKAVFRGLAKFISRDSRYPELNYCKAIEGMCARSDAVICSTQEQKKDISKFCKNAHIILDFHCNVVKDIKTSYSSGEVFNLVWEGLPCNIGSFYEIKEVLEQLKRQYRVALHVITDLQYYKYMGRFGRRQTQKLTSKLFDNIILHEWNENTCSSIITSCDMAIIPIPLDDPLAAGKPENKLLLFWRMGVPAVVSATPAYLRAMKGCGLEMACRDKNEWLAIIEKYILDANARRKAGELGRIFAENNYGENNILSAWDRVLGSVFSDTGWETRK